MQNHCSTPSGGVATLRASSARNASEGCGTCHYAAPDSGLIHGWQKENSDGKADDRQPFLLQRVCWGVTGQADESYAAGSVARRGGAMEEEVTAQ
jgi:hypothetical protein